MGGGQYILGPDHVPILELDLLAWGRWMETADRVVARTELADGHIEVSTVFLGLDHAFGAGPRRLFETLVFYNGPGARTGAMDRYPTWAMAEAGHARMVQEIRETFASARRALGGEK